jgi:hypothetical protein
MKFSSFASRRGGAVGWRRAKRHILRALVSALDGSPLCRRGSRRWARNHDTLPPQQCFFSCARVCIFIFAEAAAAASAGLAVAASAVTAAKREAAADSTTPILAVPEAANAGSSSVAMFVAAARTCPPGFVKISAFLPRQRSYNSPAPASARWPGACCPAC